MLRLKITKDDSRIFNIIESCRTNMSEENLKKNFNKLLKLAKENLEILEIPKNKIDKLEEDISVSSIISLLELAGLRPIEEINMHYNQYTYDKKNSNLSSYYGYLFRLYLKIEG